VGLCRADRVKIETLGQSHPTGGPALRGRHSLWRMLEQLEGITANETTSLYEGVKRFCLRNPSQGILVLITDLMDKAGYESALRVLLAQQLDVYLIHVLSDEELEPALVGDLRLVDCEDGDAAEITANRLLLERYKRNLAALTNGARRFCSQRGMNYLMTSSSAGVESLVANYLRRRGLVR